MSHLLIAYCSCSLSEVFASLQRTRNQSIQTGSTARFWTKLKHPAAANVSHWSRLDFLAFPCVFFNHLDLLISTFTQRYSLMRWGDVGELGSGSRCVGGAVLTLCQDALHPVS